MSAIYDNWERLVRATLHEEKLRLNAIRKFSDLSLSSFSSFNSSSSSPLSDLNGSSLLVGEAFDYDHVLRATNNLSKSNLIRHGRSGDLFRGVLDDGTPVAVKRIDCSMAENELNCRSELEVFAKASHPRLLSLLGYCFKTSFQVPLLDDWLGTSDEKFLIYSYISNRDLSRFLSTETDPNDHPASQSLDCSTRLKIATGAAEALCYLHHECVPPLVHRHVQASSILLDDIYDVQLGSLSDVCANENKVANQDTSGGRTSSATFAYDVYCFGKVLLELVTGKLWVGASGSIMNDRMEETLSYITINQIQLVRKILDPSLIINDDLLVDVWAMAVIAKACLISQPSERPPMTIVLKALEISRYLMLAEDKFSALFATFNGPIPSKNVGKQSKIGVPKLVRAKIEIACEDFVNVIGSTAAGTLYKGTLPNGFEIGVLYFSNAFPGHRSKNFEVQFRKKIMTLSRVNHTNFVNLLGYFGEEIPIMRMMVFEYVSNDTLFENLHVNEGKSLDWATRMRIVMGVAYCLAHMHQLEPPVAHGHLNSSEVHLTEDYAAKISDFKPWNEMGKARKHANPEDDVYDFGVLLLEVLTGRTVYKVGSKSLNWVSNYLGGKQPLRQLVDPTVGSFDINQIQRIDQIIKNCTNPAPRRRSAMTEITGRLREVTGIGPFDAIPELSSDRRREEQQLEILLTTAPLWPLIDIKSTHVHGNLGLKDLKVEIHS